MRNYLKLIFIVLLTGSVALFMYSAYALLDGRKMEKEYTSLTKEFNQEANNSRNALMALYATDYELKYLAGKYSPWLSVAKACYTAEDPKRIEEQNVIIKAYNEECKAKSIPESIVRPEIEEIYQKWVNVRTPIEEKQKEINSRIYADDSGKGKLDVTIVNQMAMFAGGGVFLSFIVLLLVYRVPETVTVAHKKSEVK